MLQYFRRLGSVALDDVLPDGKRYLHAAGPISTRRYITPLLQAFYSAPRALMQLTPAWLFDMTTDTIPYESLHVMPITSALLSAYLSSMLGSQGVHILKPRPIKPGTWESWEIESAR